MNFKDKMIYCCDCGTAFIFSAEKQEFLQSWGLDEPRRCPSCTQLEKSELRITGDYHGNNRRQMFKAICADCGKSTEVPFQPRPGRRVYCSDCYQKVRSSRY